MNCFNLVKKILISLYAMLLSAVLLAQGWTAGVSNMYAAPKEEKLTVPDGYRPWVISHYGRHGARFLTSADQYDIVYDAFAYEEAKGNLTEYGEKVYDKLLSIHKNFEGNAGALTQKGERQQRQIAKRMKKRFRSIFKTHPQISASSSITPRCIHSMQAFCDALGGDIEMRADTADLRVLNPFACLAPCDQQNLSSEASWQPYFRAYCDSLMDTVPFEMKLFKSGYSCSSIPIGTFEARLFSMINNLPCLDFKAPSFAGLFSETETQLLWEMDNINCFHQASAGFPGNDRRYAVCYPLLEEMIMTSDADIKIAGPSVRLRFGHDMTLNGLLTLMEIEGWNKKAGSYAGIKEVFKNWRMPMAGNIQMILFRSEEDGKQPLVRFYLHEKAIELPLTAVGDRLYKWEDFKDYYLGRVATAFRIMAQPACNFLFNIEKEYNGRPMQSFSILNDVVYVGYDSGLCRTYDYRAGRKIAEFPFGCQITSNHCGNLNFHDSLLYVSGDLTNTACYVESVTPEGTRIVQTIHFRLSDDYGGSQAVIDSERGVIVYMRREIKQINASGNRFFISEFPLPKVSEGDITYRDSDAVRTFSLEKYFPIYQGASISDGKLYQSFGGTPRNPSSEGTGFAVFDLRDGRLLDVVRVPFNMEPQSILTYKGRILMNFSGCGLYEVINSLHVQCDARIRFQGDIFC